MTGASLHAHALRIEVGEADLPEDRFNHHVNNARFFVFINRTFQQWYAAMGIRGGVPGFGAVMARVEYDFLHEVRPPGFVDCRIAVDRAGRTSLHHAIEMHDLGPSGGGPSRLVGRGRAVHVWVERASGAARPWPAEVLARCGAVAPVAGR